jgi:hypothetical protein
VCMDKPYHFHIVLRVLAASCYSSTLKMEAVGSSETTVKCYWTTRRHIPLVVRCSSKSVS